MIDSNSQKTTVSSMIGAPVLDAAAQTYGHVREIAVSPAEDSAHVAALLVQRTGKEADRRKRSLLPIKALTITSSGSMRLLAEAALITTEGSPGEFLLLERDLLDQQIIDVHGHKVVRVNDVDLLWIVPEDEGTDLMLRITGVETGLRGAVRRLLKGIPPGALDPLLARLKSSTIPWDFVDLIDRDPSRTVKLKIEQERLSKMHPSDLADILEDLAPAERQALFVSLDEDVAAETLEEIEPRMQQSLLESLNSEQVAGIVEEMDPAAAADLLSELSDERSEAILGEMDPEERQEVEELLEFSGGSAAGRMTTEYVALDPTVPVATAIATLRDHDGDVETVTDIYLIDEAGRICGLVPLVQLLFASPEATLQSLPQGHIVTCDIHANGSKVAELFDKYNLRSLPVVDEDKVLSGVIHAEQVIALLRAKH